MADQQLSAADLPPSLKLIKGLASCDATTRSKSLKTLITYLSSQTLISDDEFKKLWKALFYCMWHCDKFENQSQLINRLSNLLLKLPFPLSLSYFSHFLVTMRREWPGIDHLRLDKFYLLIRHFVRNLFELMKKSKWDLSILGEFIRVLEENAFFYEGDNGLGNGVTYHVVSVFCDEIKPFLPLSMEVLEVLFRPFFKVLSKADNKVLVSKVKGNVFDYLVKNGNNFLKAKAGGGVEVDEKSEVVLFGSIALCMGFAARFYDIGSSEECIQGNRKVVFGLHDVFVKLEKEMSGLGVVVSLPEVVDDVPDSEMNEVVEVKKVSKEKKKKKKSGDDGNGDTQMVIASESEAKKGSKEKKKSKKKKKKSGDDGNGDNTEMVIASESESLNVEVEEGGNGVELNEDMMSNLQKQFDKIAAESGLDGDGVSAIDTLETVEVSGKQAKKRKRSKSVASAGEDDVEKEGVPNAEEGKSGKKVRFAMKNNIVWKPHNPLPPQNVRIPPSSTPRGSALKKGLSPGPIRDSSQDVKKAKKKRQSPLKKARKVKTISPSVKRIKKKAKPMSA